jgi:hypothetical protein
MFVLIPGCSMQSDVDIVDYEMLALTAAVDAEANRVTQVKGAHADSIQKVAKIDNATAGEKILGIALINRDFANVVGSRISEILGSFKRATLSTDVQNTGLKELGRGLPVLAVSGVAINSDRQDRGDKIEVKGGSTANINKEANHATSLGDGSPPTTGTNAGDKHEVSFEPEVSPEEVIE